LKVTSLNKARPPNSTVTLSTEIIQFGFLNRKDKDYQYDDLNFLNCKLNKRLSHNMVA